MMKLACPFCTEGLTYDHKLAGQAVTCSYCKRAITIPTFQQLPPEMQQEYREELEAEKRKNEAQKQKLEAQRKKLEEQKQKQTQLKAQKRQAAEDRERIARIEAAEKAKVREHERKMAAALNGALEDEVVSKSYPALKTIATLYRVAAVIVGVLAVAAIIGEVVLTITRNFAVVLLTIPTIVSSALAILGLVLAAESIDLFVNMADDMRVSRALLKRIAYQTTDDSEESRQTQRMAS